LIANRSREAKRVDHNGPPAGRAGRIELIETLQDRVGLIGAAEFVAENGDAHPHLRRVPVGKETNGGTMQC